MIDEPASPAKNDLTIYDTVSAPTEAGAQESATADQASATADQASATADQASATADQASAVQTPAATEPADVPARAVTMGLLAALLLSSLTLLVAGLALAYEQDASTAVSITAIALGGSLLIWHIRALIAGTGRRTALISPWPWVGLVVIAAFGAAMGFSLFDVLTGVRSAARIALVSAGTIGLVSALIGFIRDSDLHERGLDFPVPQPPLAEPEQRPAQPVFFDPTRKDDALRPRGTWPQPKRGSAADASLWDEPQFEPEQPARRARRAAE